MAADEHDDLLDRVRAATEGVSATPGSAERVQGALARRRRRRRARIGAGAVSAVAALALAGAVVLPDLGAGSGEGLTEVPEVAEVTEPDAAPGAIEGGSFRPAGFFRDVAGGVALPTITRYYRIDPGVVLTARFDWAPDPAGASYLGDLTLERFRSDAGSRCARLAARLGAGACAATGDGTVLARYEVPVDGAFLAPLNEEGRLRLPGSAGVLRGVTAFRPDGRAVTVLVCSCAAQDGAVLAAEPPVTFEVLEEVVTDPSWGLPVGG